MVPPALPSCTDQTTAEFAAPLTEAVKVWAVPGAMVATPGEIDTAADGAATATVATSDFVGSATLVATTWKVPAVPGAVYAPVEFTVPPPASCTDHVTEVAWVAAATVTAAVNPTEPLGATAGSCGLTDTVKPEAAPCPLQAPLQATTSIVPRTTMILAFICTSRDDRRVCAREAANSKMIVVVGLN
jgi:hypothetical protein